MLHKIVRALLAGMAIGAVVFGAFYLVNGAAVQGPASPMAAHIRLAYQQGQLDGADHKRGNTDVGEHQFNDCLILGMALDTRAGARALRVSPAHPFPDMNAGVCEDLDVVSREGFARRPVIFYHNYVHGQVTLARLLLPGLRVDQIRALYKTLAILLVAAGVIVALGQLVIGRARGAFWALLFFVFARWFGLESFGQSLGHGPSDMTILAYAVFLAIGSARGGWGPTTCMVSAAVFGGATMIFEMMTGGIPLGLALIVGGLPFACNDREMTGRAVTGSVLAYAGAIAACCVAKLALVANVFGWAAVTAIGGRGLQRMAGAPSGERIVDVSIGNWASQILDQMTGLAPGMALMTGFVLQTIVVAAIWGLLTLRRQSNPAANGYARYLALSNLPILLWLAVFAQHSIVHAWFMTRMFAWTIASGLAIFFIAAIATWGDRWWRAFATTAEPPAPA